MHSVGYIIHSFSNVFGISITLQDAALAAVTSIVKNLCGSMDVSQFFFLKDILNF